MIKRTGTSLLAALLLVAVWLASATPLHAQTQAQTQTEQEAADILTTGQWRVRGIPRTFNTDGTFSTGNGTKGTWTITDGNLIIKPARGKWMMVVPLPIDPQGSIGTDENGNQVKLSKVPDRKAASGNDDNENPASSPRPAPPPTADAQQRAGEIVQTHRGALVFVTGSDAAGSGFFAKIGGGTFLVTNVHVAAGIRDAAFRTMDGSPVQGGAASMAVGEDIFCMAIPSSDSAGAFEIMQNVDANAAIGDDVVVLGNAEGAGVVNTITGKIVGIGPNLVEVNAPFVPGNSGSPIIDLKTGTVVGVATYLVTNQYDLSTNQRLKQPVVRRFGYRLDSIKKWQPVYMPAFYSQAATMDSIENLTDDLYAFFQDVAVHNGRVTPELHTNPVIKERINDWLAAKSNHPSAQDAADADASFLSFLKIACQSDINAAQRQITYDYFVRDLADQERIRNQMSKAFEELIQDVSQ